MKISEKNFPDGRDAVASIDINLAYHVFKDNMLGHDTEDFLSHYFYVTPNG